MNQKSRDQNLNKQHPSPDELRLIQLMMQTLNNNFWTIEQTISRHEEIGKQLIAIREDTSKIVRIFKKAYPDTFQSFDMMTQTGPKLSAVQ